MIDNSRGTVVLLTALEVEFAAVERLLHRRRVVRHHAGTSFTVAELPGVEGTIVLAVTGAGNQAAATLTERAITHFRPTAVLFTGIAGALHEDLEMGSVVVGTKIYGYHGGIDETAGFRARPEAWPADHTLEELARQVSRAGSWYNGTNPPTVVLRPIAAGEVVLNSAETSLASQLRTTYNDAAAVEMESAGAARAAHLNRVPFLAIRGISDKADGEKHNTDRQGYQSIAASNAATFGVAVARAVLASITSEIAYGTSRTDLPSNDDRQAEGRRPVAWTLLPQPVDVMWKSDRPGHMRSSERTSLEVHVAPTSPGRLEMRRLDRLVQELPAFGRMRELFDGVEELAIGTREDIGWVESRGHRTGPRGLAVWRSGQRSVWSPMPSDMLGAILDRDELTDHIANSIGLLVALDLPAPADVAIAVGFDSATMLAEGRVTDRPRRQASGFKMQSNLRVPADESLRWQELLEAPDEIADELAARLVAAFRQAR